MMSRSRLYLFVVICCLLWFQPSRTLSAAPTPEWTLVYKIGTDQFSEIHWLNMGNSVDQMMRFSGWTGLELLNPRRDLLALMMGMGRVGIVNPETQETVFLPVPMEPYVERTYLYDEYTAFYHSLLWSPDGRYLAYTGQSGNNRLDVYLYDTITKELRNLSANLPVADVDVGSWSNDSRWLQLLARYDEDGFEPIIVSPDMRMVNRISPQIRACRFIWSPDNRHIVSDDGCYHPLGSETHLTFWAFDPDQPEKPSTAPVALDIPREDAFRTCIYSTPHWRDSRTIITLRTICRYASEFSDAIEITQLVAYDILSGKEQSIAVPGSPKALFADVSSGNWITFSTDTERLFAYHVLSGQFIEVTGLFYPCAFYPNALSEDGTRIAIPNHCGRDPAAFRVFDLPSRREILHFPTRDNQYFRAIGFIKSVVP